DALVRAHMLTELFGIEAAGERSRTDQIAKHDGELPPFGVARSVVALCRFGRGRNDSLATSAAELVARLVDEPAAAARERQRGAALRAEASALAVLCPAAGTCHRKGWLSTVGTPLLAITPSRAASLLHRTTSKQ